MNTDMELIQLVLDGEINAYNDILLRYEKPVYRFVANIVKNDDTAKDITQEVFIKVYYKLYTYKKKYKFSNWIFQIAMNKAIDYMRKNKKRQEINLDGMELLGNEMSPENFAEYMETKKKLETFIKTLGMIEQQILVLKYSYEKVTFGDIAEILKINESTVKYKYYRIYDKYEKYVQSEKGVVSYNEL